MATQHRVWIGGSSTDHTTAKAAEVAYGQARRQGQPCSLYKGDLCIARANGADDCLASQREAMEWDGDS